MNKNLPIFAIALSLAITVPTVLSQDNSMSFFITSAGPGDGANLGGIDGADAHCQELADAAGAGEKTWKAYLSVSGTNIINARDRIGSGPWYNAKGVAIAQNLEDLHSENAKTGKGGSLNEKGSEVNGRGDAPNMHDIITGSTLNGMAIAGNGDTTCSNWTNNGEGSARVGHHDRQGGGENPNSWNSAHGSRGCGQTDLQGTGGNGLFYCFATD
ncbi:uncharacterized protein METZ01_LOCUS22726 [marine metagenome]|uniref:Lectin n=1 Tax=marine metagenome TaxID=408172 RepID=A0A381PS51_9ZZZZ